jgi:hypothetical protein
VTITDEDMRIAHRMSRRYNGNKRFGHEDAFQAAMEGLIKAGVPTNEGLRVLAMKNGISRQVTMAVFPMCIPRSSYDRMRKENRLPGVVSNDVTVSDLVFEVTDTDTGFDHVEDLVLVEQILASLDKHELRVVKTFMAGKGFGYKHRQRDRDLLKATLDKIRQALKEDS